MRPFFLLFSPGFSPSFDHTSSVESGVVGNRSAWIFEALRSSLTACAAEAADVKLVHFGSLTKGAFGKLETKRGKNQKGGKGAGQVACCFDCGT